MSDIYVKADVCDKVHKRVDERLDHHEHWLEKSDATNTNEIKNLCNRIGSQTTAIWGLVCAIVSVLVGFFVWYVQNK